MLLLFKTLIPLLAIVEIVMGQTSNANNTVTVGSKFQINSILKAQASGTTKSLCNAPIDGKAGHFCTNDQIIKALEILENSCKDELEKKHELVWERYSVLLEYPLIRDLICKKDPDGSYCLENMTDEGVLISCQVCELFFLEAVFNWKHIRSNSFAKKTIKQCNTPVNNTSYSSTDPGYFSYSFTASSYYNFGNNMSG
ncbi:hypothetical protein BDF19DRAFT_448968 [Syncephalis fuscata]|nr:hypothetical protein BDF19DRAFT_448968 [Syncephalis fuscata]